MMAVDYVAPSLDTTILASAQMLWRLATTPGTFAALKANPKRARSVVNESVRLASPVREFTRLAVADYATADGTIPAGKRAAMLFASANWDEDHYERADEFVVDRDPRDHLGWGHGSQICAGMPLARLEMEALARAMAQHVDSIAVGDLVPLANNVMQGFAALPARFS